jgi:hypothetical protein
MDFLQLIEESISFSNSHLPFEFIAGSTALLEGLEQLMQREYWKRTWIIQEILKATQIIVHCGYQTLRWESLVKFFYQIREVTFETDELFGMWPDPIRPRLAKLCQSIPARLTQHNRYEERSLEELLETYKDSLSSDPRDKIFSLVGLAGRKLCRGGSVCDDGTSVEEATPPAIISTLYQAPSSVSRVGSCNALIPIDYSISELELFRLLVLKFNFEEPSSAFQVRRMKLLQETLGLQPPGLDICSNTDLFPISSEPTLPLANGCITALGHSSSKVSDCGLFWHCNSRVEERSWGNKWLWHDTQLISPWLWQCLEYAHDDNLKRLDMGPCCWDTTGFRVFVDTRGYVGLGRSCVQVGDRIVQFHDSGIALIVRGSTPVVVIGRALFLSSEAERESVARMEEYITLALDKWRSLVW